MTSDLVDQFSKALHENARASTRSMVIAGALGTFIFGAYGVLWLYVTPLEHESLGLRLLGMLACVGLWFSPRWPERYKKYLPWLWFGTLCYALPFFSTYQLLASNYSTLRSMIEVATVFLLIGLFPNYMLAGVNMVVGASLGTLAAYLMLPDFWTLNHAILKSVHIPALLYCSAAGMILTRSHLKGLLTQEKIGTMKSLMGSIAHEMKGPLGHISLRLNKVGTLLPDHLVGTQTTQVIHLADLESIYTELAKCKEAIERSSQVIDMTMGEIHAQPIDQSGHRYLSACDTVNKALAEFSYTRASDRDRITVLTNNDFIFKGDETRFIFTLSNLLKNAIYYFDRYPEAGIVIRVDHQTVTVEDTGPGMKPEVLARVFEAFHSVGKPGGTGLGLSFCKRTMLTFGGDITCASTLGKSTRFVMSFPRVAPQERIAHDENVKQRAIDLFKGKRVLVVDDSRHFRNMARKLLSVLGVVVDEAEDGNDALAKLAAQPYDAMLLDLSMPGLDGYATAERLRDGAVPGRENLAIVAHSSESPHAARVRLERIGVNEFVSKGCNPLDLFDAMCRAHHASEQRARTVTACARPSGKSILLIEDDDFCRKVVRTALLAEGFLVQEAPSGQIALNLLNDTSVKIDAVVTDIYMSGLDGFEIARTLRARPLPLSALPVIALSAHCDEAMLSDAREAGINGFLTKPVNEAELTRALRQQLGDTGVEKAEPLARAAPSGGLAVLDVAKLEVLDRMGLGGDDLLQAMKEAHTQWEELAAQVKAMDLPQAKALLHGLMGLAGQLGAAAAHGEMQARYVFMLESGLWPTDSNWLAQLRQRLIETERQLEAHLKKKHKR